MLATLTAEISGEKTVVRLAGEVDILSIAGLRDALTGYLARRPRVLVVDLARVTFFAVSGVSALIATRHAADAQGVRLLLARPSRAVRRTLELTGADVEFDIADQLRVP